MDERDLILRAQRGDSEAFASLMGHHAPFVYNLALRTLNNAQEAEDIAQEAFVQVWRALPKFRGDAQFRTWLYRIVTNLCYKRLPKMKREFAALEGDESAELPDDSQRVEAALLSAEMRDELQLAIQQLPESYRLLITLRHLQGMSYAQIAAVTEQPLGTVKTGIFRARRELRAALRPYQRELLL